ncbi:MAG: alpha-glucosidase [Longibaculum sp.]
MEKWWKSEVGYQIYPRSFFDSNDDGIGDLRGIINKLDYLHDLGVTLLWICPIYLSPMEDNGYDISDYYEINPEFGTKEDLDMLIKEAKKRDMKIIMDLVINHTSSQHYWFQDAIKNPHSPYRDFYIFKEEVDGHAPNNWRSVFGGSVWERVEGTPYYYYHSFAKGQPDLNWENPKMREEIYKMINYWLEKGISGFRVDAINFIKKDQSYQDGPIDGNDGLSNCFSFGRNMPGIEVFFRELRERTFDVYNCMTVAEAVGVPYDELGVFIGENGCFSMMFDFSYSNFDIDESEDWFKRIDWTVEQFKEILFRSQEEIQKVGWCAPFLENHDQPRAIDKLIVDKKDRNIHSITMIAAMYFFLRGTPFIYQGQEIGMCNFERQSIDEFNDINSHAQYHRAIEEGCTPKEALHYINIRSRDNTRTPMQWNSQDYAGFSKHEPWILMNPNYKEINVESQIHDPNSIYSFYRKMISVRQKSIASEVLTYGKFKPLKTQGSIIAYERCLENMKVVVYCNFSNVAQPIEMKVGKVLLNNYTSIDMNQLKPYQTLLIYYEL